MAHKAIREYDGKKLLCALLPKYSNGGIQLKEKLIQITPQSNFAQLRKNNSWVAHTKLVVKPDQLIKRRMQNNLVLLDASWEEAVQWVSERMSTEITLDGIKGRLDTFLIEPFYPHAYESEYYIAIRTVREGDEILFHRQGGISVGDIDRKAKRLVVGVLEDIDQFNLNRELLDQIRPERRSAISQFIKATYKAFVECEFAYLEVNPAVYIDRQIVPLDLAARLDDSAGFESKQLWGSLAFPPPFGRRSSPEEEHVRAIDENSGASLKLTLLNPKGRIWTLLAGGGASVVFTDTIADFGFGSELANYGEYSGNPTDEESYEYADTVLSLMTREKDAENRGKVLIVGGGIANFTDVAKTFRGVSKALSKHKEGLKRVGAKVYVRRGGPNYKEGLRNMKILGEELGVPMEVYGPETHMTRIVGMALDVGGAK